MRRAFFIPLRITLAAAFAMTVLATAALIGASSYFAAVESLREGIRLRLKELITLAAPTVDVEMVARLRKPEDMAAPEYAKVKAHLQKLKATSPDIRFVYLYRIDDSGNATFVADNEPENSPDVSPLGDEYDEITDLGRSQYSRRARPEVEREITADRWGSFLSAYAPILNSEGQLECAIGIDMSAQAVEAYNQEFVQSLITLTVLFVGIALIGSLIASRAVSKPLLAIASDLGRVQRLELDHDSGVKSVIREVTLMNDAVTRLKSSLRSFRKYVPADVVTDLMTLGQEAQLGAVRKEVTLFFSDIVNFSTISEKVSPEQLVDDLSEYLDRMTNAIHQSGGTVDKYIGDAIMAFWGAPREVANHATLACLAAILCRDHSQRIGKKQQEIGKLPMFTRIGLHTGTALIGNIGYTARLNYTAIGDAVNLASRLEGLNKYYGTEILISEATRAAAGDGIETRLVDLVAVKGKKVAVRVYELLCVRGALSSTRAALVAEYERGLELYLRREFEAAHALFEKLAQDHPTDGPTAVMRARCQRFSGNPPDASWQGEFAMDSK